MFIDIDWMLLYYNYVSKVYFKCPTKNVYQYVGGLNWQVTSICFFPLNIFNLKRTKRKTIRFDPHIFISRYVPWNRVQLKGIRRHNRLRKIWIPGVWLSLVLFGFTKNRNKTGLIGNVGIWISGNSQCLSMAFNLCIFVAHSYLFYLGGGR